MHLETRNRYTPPSPTSRPLSFVDLYKTDPYQAVQLINYCVGKSAMSCWILADIGSEKIISGEYTVEYSVYTYYIF